VPLPDVSAAPYRVRPAPFRFPTEAEACAVFTALHCFYREVGRNAMCVERLPCKEGNPDGTGGRRAPEAKQTAGFLMQHVAHGWGLVMEICVGFVCVRSETS
jgi:hypothetical protein